MKIFLKIHARAKNAQKTVKTEIQKLFFAVKRRRSHAG